MEPIEMNPLGMPSNSRNRAAQEKPKLEAIATTVTPKKKPWYKRAGDTLLAEDANSVGAFVMRDIIIPTIKDTIYDIITGGLQMAMYGSTKARSRKSNSISTPNGGSYVSYGGYFNGSKEKAQPRPDNRINIDDLIFGMADEAHQVLDALADRGDAYGCVTVQDLYDLIGVSAPRTAMYWGWNDLSNASVRKVREGWLLDLPRPVPLK